MEQSGEARVTASIGRFQVSARCEISHGDGQRFGGTCYSLFSWLGALGISWAAERPRISGPGHCVGEETGAQKREGPHPVSPSWPVTALALEPALPWVGVGEDRCVPVSSA